MEHKILPNILQNIDDKTHATRKIVYYLLPSSYPHFFPWFENFENYLAKIFFRVLTFDCYIFWTFNNFRHFSSGFLMIYQMHTSSITLFGPNYIPLWACRLLKAQTWLTNAMMCFSQMLRFNSQRAFGHLLWFTIHGTIHRVLM